MPLTKSHGDDRSRDDEKNEACSTNRRVEKPSNALARNPEGKRPSKIQA
jgi:hypothetical protein